MSSVTLVADASSVLKAMLNMVNTKSTVLSFLTVFQLCIKYHEDEDVTVREAADEE